MKRMIRVLLITCVIGLSLTMAGRNRELALMAKVHAQEGCSVATLQGAYAFYRTGATPDGPLAAAGIATFDGKGSTTARQTIRKNGVTISDLFTDPPQVGLYQVDSDCAGRFLTADGTVFAHIVIVDGAKELFGISLSDDNTVTGVWKKMNGSEQ